MIVEERFYEDYEIGERRQTLGRTITEADIVIHAGQTGDFFPHHMDAEWCATQDFKKRMAHGTLVFSVGIGMTASDINPRSMSYGYDRLRFIKPVFIGDTLRVVATIKEKRAASQARDPRLCRRARRNVNQAGETVLACEHLYLVERRALVESGDDRKPSGPISTRLRRQRQLAQIEGQSAACAGVIRSRRRSAGARPCARRPG